MSVVANTTLCVHQLESFANRVCEGLKEFYPNNTFDVLSVRASDGWRVVVQTSAAGLRLVPDRQLYGMERFAVGFLAALKTHCK